VTDLLASLAEQHRDHSIFSPSAAARWSTCPGSLVACALAPNTAGGDAAEGTVAHALAEQWLRTGVRPSDMTPVTVDGYAITPDDAMLAYVEQYVEWCNEGVGDRYVEQHVDLTPVMPIAGQGGTADYFLCEFGRLTITDLKYGKGVRVYAEDNPQAQLYALGVFFAWDWYYHFDTIVIRICQPRLDHFDSWTITRDDLLRFAGWIRERALDAWRLDAPRKPSEKACQFCAVQKNCPAYLAWFAALADDVADDVFGLPAMAQATLRTDDPFDQPFDIPELTVEQWCRILSMRKPVEAWFAAGEAKVFGAAQAGFDTPGWKIVEGRSNRVWQDESKAQARMVEVGIPISETETRKLLSPNQAEEALHGLTRMPKKKAAALFDALTERKDGGLSLVRQSDKREAVPSHGDVFDD
jgi:hypothetical protein